MADASETSETATESTETIAEWASGIEDEDFKIAAGKFESQDAALKALGYKAPDPYNFRTEVSEEFQETAKRFTSLDDAFRSIQDFRKRESQVRVPGKDATDEERAAYNKAIGVPESSSDYEFPAVEDMTDEIKASQETWGKRFHDLGVSKDTAKSLAEMLNEDVQAQLNAQIEADKAFAESQENALKTEWKAEYDTNVTLANRAVAEIANRAGINIETLKQVETKDGRFLLDRSDILKLFATVGREMAEGTLGPTMSDSERETASDQLRDLRKQISEAQSEGDSKRANQLYQREQALIAKMEGNKPVVGVGGRVV